MVVVVAPGAVVLVLVSGVASADPDSWVSTDKAIHFGFSGALAIGGYGAATAFSESPTVRLEYGAAVALIAGVGKELWDASGHGDPSWRDFTWDVSFASTRVNRWPHRLQN